MAIDGRLFAEAYGTQPNTADIYRRAGEQLGQNLAKGIEGYAQRENILREEEKKAATDTFQIPVNETDPEDIKLAKRQAAMDIVNQAAEDARLLRRGKIGSEEYKTNQAELSKQVNQLNAAGSYIDQNVATLKQFQDPNSGVQPSAAMDTKALAVQDAMAKGTITANWNPETRKIEYSGTFKDENDEDVQIDNVKVGDEAYFPRPVVKVKSADAALANNTINVQKALQSKSIEEGIEYTGVSWDDPRVQASMTNVIDEQVPNDNAALSMAVDHLGIPKEEAYALLKEGSLQDEVKGKLLETAKAHIDAIPQSSKIATETQLGFKESAEGRAKNADARAQEQYEYNKDQRGKAGVAGGVTPNKLADIKAEEARIAQDTQLYNNAIVQSEPGKFDNLQGLIGKGDIQNVEWDRNTFNNGGVVEIQLKGQDDTIDFEVGADGKLPPAAQQLLYTQLNLGTSGQSLNAQQLREKYSK